MRTGTSAPLAIQGGPSPNVRNKLPPPPPPSKVATASQPRSRGPLLEGMSSTQKTAVCLLATGPDLSTSDYLLQLVAETQNTSNHPQNKPKPAQTSCRSMCMRAFKDSWGFHRSSQRRRPSDKRHANQKLRPETWAQGTRLPMSSKLQQCREQKSCVTGTALANNSCLNIQETIARGSVTPNPNPNPELTPSLAAPMLYPI